MPVISQPIRYQATEEREDMKMPLASRYGSPKRHPRRAQLQDTMKRARNLKYKVRMGLLWHISLLRCTLAFLCSSYIHPSVVRLSYMRFQIFPNPLHAWTCILLPIRKDKSSIDWSYGKLTKDSNFQHLTADQRRSRLNVRIEHKP